MDSARTSESDNVRSHIGVEVFSSTGLFLLLFSQNSADSAFDIVGVGEYGLHKVPNSVISDDLIGHFPISGDVCMLTSLQLSSLSILSSESCPLTIMLSKGSEYGLLLGHCSSSVSLKVPACDKGTGIYHRERERGIKICYTSKFH